MKLRNIKTSAVVLALAGLLALVAAGCGSSSSSSTSTSTPSATATTKATTSATTKTSTSASAATPAPTSKKSKQVAAQAVATCKAVVSTRPGLSGSLKSKLLGICNQAATVKRSKVAQILAQECTKIVNSTVPSSAPKSVKDQALSECKKAFS